MAHLIKLAKENNIGGLMTEAKKYNMTLYNNLQWALQWNMIDYSEIVDYLEKFEKGERR